MDTNPDYGSLGRTLASGHKDFVDDLLDVLDEPTLVVNKMPAAKRARIDVDAFASAIHEINALIVVDVDDRAAARVAAGEFSWSEAPAEWRRAIGELATVLEADWPALGLSA